MSRKINILCAAILVLALAPLSASANVDPQDTAPASVAAKAKAKAKKAKKAKGKKKKVIKKKRTPAAVVAPSPEKGKVISAEELKAEEAAKAKRAEEALKLQKASEDATKSQKAASEDAVKAQKAAEEAIKAQKAAEEMIKAQKADESARAAKLVSEDAAKAQRSAEEALRSQRAAEEALKAQRADESSHNHKITVEVNRNDEAKKLEKAPAPASLVGATFAPIAAELSPATSVAAQPAALPAIKAPAPIAPATSIAPVATTSAITAIPAVAAAPVSAEPALIPSDRVPSTELMSNKMGEKFSVKVKKVDEQHSTADFSLSVFSQCHDLFSVEKVAPSKDDESTNQAGFRVIDKDGKGRACVSEIKKQQVKLGAAQGCSNAPVREGSEIKHPFTCSSLTESLDLSSLKGKTQVGIFAEDEKFDTTFSPVKEAVYVDPAAVAAEKAEKLAVDKAKRIEDAKKMLDCESCASDKLAAAFKDLQSFGLLQDELEISEAQAKIMTRRLAEISKSIKVGKSNEKARKDLLDIAEKNPNLSGDVALIFAQMASDMPSKDMDEFFGDLKALNQIATGGSNPEVHNMIADAMHTATEKMIERKENPTLGDYKKAEKMLKSAKGLAGVSSDKKREMAKEIASVKKYQFSIIADKSDAYSYMMQVKGLQEEANRDIQRSCRNSSMGMSDSCAIAREQYAPVMSNVGKIFQTAQEQKARAYQQEVQMQTMLNNSMNNPGSNNFGLFNTNSGNGGLNSGLGNNQIPISSPSMQSGLTLR